MITFALDALYLNKYVFSRQRIYLTHGSLVTPYGQIDLIFANIGSGNGLLPGGTKP